MIRITAVLIALVALPVLSAQEPVRGRHAWRAACDGITPARLREHVEVLASDEMEGREAGTRGARRARDYLRGVMNGLGLEPAYGRSWTRRYTVREVTTSKPRLHVKSRDLDLALLFGEEYVGWSRRGAGAHACKGEMVYVGHGIQAPEYEWDDYKGLDCRGKILLMLVGDPAGDPKIFGGPAMTLYGRWTWKLQKAREMGAAGCIIVHETSRAGYGWEVVRNSNRGKSLDLADDSADGHLPLEGWIPWDVARVLVSGAGGNMQQLADRAARRDFRPVAIGVTGTWSCENAETTFSDENVAGLVRGSDRADEVVVLTAHYDHIGSREVDDGEDGIYNGAVDNASGVSAVLEMARAAVAAAHNRRSLMFLFVGGEEKGLLGSRAYVGDPAFPLEKTVANINIDGLNVWAKSRDLEVIGRGQSTLEDVLESVLESDGRVIVDDRNPQAGYYYRSDHLNFARAGVPALYVKPGRDGIGPGSDVLGERLDAWRSSMYHQPGDELRPSWSFLGGAADARALFQVALRVANADKRPAWKEGSEFR